MPADPYTVYAAVTPRLSYRHFPWSTITLLTGLSSCTT